MEIRPATIEPSAAPRRRRGKTYLSALGVLLFVVILVFALTPPRADQLTWLSPAEVASASNSSPLTALKYKLIRYAWPVWQFIQRNRRQIQVTARVLTISPAASARLQLGPPLSTSTNHLRAWVLSPAELKIFLDVLKNNQDVLLVSMPRLQTFSGSQARLLMLSSAASATNKFQYGTVIDVVPKAFSDSVKLTVGVTSTDFIGMSSNNIPQIVTNLAAGCRVLVPNEGALVMDGGASPTPGSSNFWLVLTPLMMDSYGRPIKR